MPKLILICDQCGEEVEETRSEILETRIVKFLSCGHKSVEKLAREKDATNVVFDDERKPFPHQIENLEFARDANFRFLCADDTGLGKTITACGTLYLYPKTLYPVVIVSPATLTTQWMHEFFSVCGIDRIPWQVRTGKEKIPQKDVYIISYDILARLPHEVIVEKFAHVNYVILDEVHAIKNLDAKRTKAVQVLCAGKPHLLGLGATPFKNNLIEYFPILNLLDPGKFHGQAWFIKNFVDTFWKGSVMKYGGLREWSAPRFKQLISNLVIRHERSQVMKDLPPILESQRFFDLSDVAKYEKAEKEFEDAFDKWEEEGWNQANRMALGQSLMKLKHIAGIQKVPYAIEMIRSFLEENPPNGNGGRKLTVFVHHHDVGDAICDAVKEMSESGEYEGLNPAITIRGDAPREVKDQIAANCAQFHWPSENPGDRILVASTLSGGVGLNLQACYDAILVERQWNPSNERQAKGRFPRPGSAAKSGVFWNVMVLLGTLDEDLVKINERKASYDPNVTGDVNETPWDESEFMMELGDAIRERRNRR